MPIALPLSGMLLKRFADANSKMLRVICVILNDYANFIAIVGASVSICPDWRVIQHFVLEPPAPASRAHDTAKINL